MDQILNSLLIFISLYISPRTKFTAPKQSLLPCSGTLKGPQNQLNYSTENSLGVGSPLLVYSWYSLLSCAQHWGLNPVWCWTFWPQPSKALNHIFNVSEKLAPQNSWEHEAGMYTSTFPLKIHNAHFGYVQFMKWIKSSHSVSECNFLRSCFFFLNSTVIFSSIQLQ